MKFKWDSLLVIFMFLLTGCDDIGFTPVSASADNQIYSKTERVSIASDDSQADNISTNPAISINGRYVTFGSTATNLVDDDTNWQADIFVHDRNTGVNERVSVASNGSQADNISTNPAISADGRYVTFSSSATNLVADDTNWLTDIFVHDRDTGITERISVASDGSQSNNISGASDISGDGRYVTFSSNASNLVVNDTNGAEDVFVHDRDTGITERVSVASDGAEGDSISGAPDISGNGRYVTFLSNAANLIDNDSNRLTDIFVHDRYLGITERISVASDGAQSDNISGAPDISRDGRYVAFVSTSSNLVDDDTNWVSDVFVHDRDTGITERISVASDGEQTDNISRAPAINGDGRYVTFSSNASNLVDDDTNWLIDIFVHDRDTGITERISVASDGEQADNISSAPAINGNGCYVTFLSNATNLVDDDTNWLIDVFVRSHTY